MNDERCKLCPRNCGADRRNGRGRCGAGAGMEVATVCIHRGEEPPLVPIVNVFFEHCNLGCIYCQNWQISGGTGNRDACDTETLAARICDVFASLFSLSSGKPAPPMLGFVTAAHYADRLPAVVEAVRRRGWSPTVVYNSSGYESVETLRTLEGVVDVYLPDLKYMDRGLAAAYSHAADYPEVAAAALTEMRRQVGGGLATDPDSGQALRGIIVRHLVLPGATGNSIGCLEWLADHFNPFSLHLSLMAQYYPPKEGLPPPLDRTITEEEYRTVVDHAESLGLTSGWIQEMNAQANYRPDFDNPDNPFEP